jgi:hypothetical protein
LDVTAPGSEKRGFLDGGGGGILGTWSSGCMNDVAVTIIIKVEVVDFGDDHRAWATRNPMGNLSLGL